MSIYFSNFGLNTYGNMPYFLAQIPDGYPLSLVLQKCRAFRRLPKHLQELSRLSKEWTQKHYPERMAEIEPWYDEDGYELNPDTGKRLTDEEIDAQWQPNADLDELVVKDIPIPEGGFADPSTWEPAKQKAEGDRPEQPTKEQLLHDIASHGRKRVARAYGIPEDKLPT